VFHQGVGVRHDATIASGLWRVGNEDWWILANRHLGMNFEEGVFS
jgi:hypothetical protein